MKKIIISILLMFLVSPAFSKTIEGSVTVDWISKTQIQRDENIKQIQNILFTDETVLKYPKKEFKSKYADFLKDSDHLKNYEEILNGKKEDENAYYCSFMLEKPDIMFMYAIQYKKDLKHIYYYNALGHLRLIDVFSENYPNFPYRSYQYSVKGKLIAAYYFNSAYDQYAYDSDKKFRGRWYKENYYNRRAKIIMTRSNY